MYLDYGIVNVYNYQNLSIYILYLNCASIKLEKKKDAMISIKEIKMYQDNISVLDI